MVAIWTDTVRHQTGEPSMRGLAGDCTSTMPESKAIPVDGTLVVYAFDDSRGEFALAREPDRRFIFRQEEFVERSDKTALGQSYNVWIPWDGVGGERAEVTLMPDVHLA
jgi:hypothetical protein